MRSKIKFPYIIIMSLILLLLLGIGIYTLVRRNAGSEYIRRGDDKSYIVVISKSDVSAFWRSVSYGAHAAASEYNLNMTFVAPASEENYEAQNEMIRAAIMGQAQAIIFSAIDYNGNAEAINEAIEAGIPVIVIDSDVNCEEVSCRIMTDNYLAGRMAGEQALENNPGPLTVGIVNYDIYTVNCVSTRESASRGRCSFLRSTRTLIRLRPLMSL